MKKNYFPALIPVFGAVALWLRWNLYRVGVDDRGLLVPFHMLEIRLWVLTAAVLAAVIWVIRSKQTIPALPGWASSAGCLVLAVAIAVFGDAKMVSSSGILWMLHLIFRWVALVALTELAYARLLNRHSLFVNHLIIAVYFAFHALTSYQSWSRDPQMMNYVFALLSCICLMLFSYQQAAAEVGIGSRKIRLFVGMMGGYLCCAAFPQGEWLYLAGAVWMLTNLERN